MYKKYMELQFVRTDMGDTVEYNETGYYGFSLEKIINDKLRIIANYNELDKPKLYIKKSDSDITYHILPITFEMVKDLCV